MGKKKKLPKKSQIRDPILGDIISRLTSITEDSSSRTELTDYFDAELYLDPERLAKVIKNRVEHGETAYNIAAYSHEALKYVTSFLQIDGRASMTRKKEMAVALVKHFGGKKKQWKDV